MKKIIAVALGMTLAASLAACNGDTGTNGGTGGDDVPTGDQSRRIALIAKANSAEYWVKVRDGAYEAGQELGVDVTFNGPDTENEGDRQLNMLESAINDGAMGIGFAPQDGAQDGSPRLMEQAEAAGIPVAIFDTPLEHSDIPIATVASDNEGMGAQAAQQLIELTGGEGAVAIIAHGEIGTAAARRDGFIQYIEDNAPGMEVVSIQNGLSDPAISRDRAQATLQAHPDLVGFFGTDDDSTIGAADEVAARDLPVVVVGVDSSPDVLTLVEDGSIAGVITQNPFAMGYETVRILVEAADGTMPAESNVVSESVWVTAENMNDPEIQQVIN